MCLEYQHDLSANNDKWLKKCTIDLFCDSVNFTIVSLIVLRLFLWMYGIQIWN
jgi:hypothetical protein